MRVNLEIALATLEKAAAIITIAVPAIRKIASIMDVSPAETE